MSETPLKNKSFNFALRTIKLYKYLVDEKKEYVLISEQRTTNNEQFIALMDLYKFLILLIYKKEKYL